MDAAIPADAQNAPTGIWKSRTEREIPTAPTPIIVVVNERKNNGDSNSVAKPSTESDQAHVALLGDTRSDCLGGGSPSQRRGVRERAARQACPEATVSTLGQPPTRPRRFAQRVSAALLHHPRSAHRYPGPRPSCRQPVERPPNRAPTTGTGTDRTRRALRRLELTPVPRSLGRSAQCRRRRRLSVGGGSM